MRPFEGMFKGPRLFRETANLRDASNVPVPPRHPDLNQVQSNASPILESLTWRQVQGKR
jgi:hypothetical protein